MAERRDGRGRRAAESEIAASWEANASAWVDAVRGGRIESRRRITDAAILDALAARAPGRVLDLGCGEGWLCRELAARGAETVGVDASAALVEAARAGGGGTFRRLAYADLVARPRSLGAFDAIVLNFALLGEDVAALLEACRAALAPGGAVVVQTVHPWAGCAGARYADGWRVERFEAFGDFPASMPWFFRTLESWLAAFAAAGLVVDRLAEPLDPATGRPASLLVIAVPRRPAPRRR